MKFAQRLGMLSTVMCLAILYLLLVYSQGSVHAPSGHPSARLRRRALLMDYEFEQPWQPSYQPSQCDSENLAHSQLIKDNSSIFTVDLPEMTNYQVHSNKQYSLPHPKLTETNTERLNVVIVPYSHVDAGWLRTAEEYYVYHVRGILDNMVTKLNRYEEMKFVWAETVFLSMWWNELDDYMKHKVRRLIDRGQLEIVLGGWVMTDEASTHYVSILDQLMEGHQWIAHNLHTKPVNSWAIDPFGHSATMAYLLKQAGMDNMVIQRVHQAIKATLAGQKALEFKWRQMWDNTGHTDILCHIMPYIYYGAKHSCGPDKQICAMYDYGIPKSIFEKPTGRKVTDINLETQAKYLYTQYRKKAGLFKYNTVLIPLGDDFRFDSAEEWDLHYENYIKIMKYINNKHEWNMNVKFGTLQDYFNLVNNEQTENLKYRRDFTFPVLKGDFFPYSDLDSEYWTGYYSSRPFHKQLSRDLEASLRSADILTTLAHSHCLDYGVDYENHLDAMEKLQEVRRNLGLFLHHDAITGTSKPYVVHDYESKLLQAFNMSQSVISAATQNILTQCNNDDPVVINTHKLRRDAYTPPSKYITIVTKTGTKLFFFNPVAQERSEYVTVTVDTVNINIRNSQDLHIPFQINPVFKQTKFQTSEFNIVFMVDLPPFAIETFTVYKVDAPQYGLWSSVETMNTGKLELPANTKFQYTYSDKLVKASSIENEHLKASFDQSGMLSSVYYKDEEVTKSVKLDFLSYASQGSGAYLFSPDGEAKNIITDTQPSVMLIKGPFTEQIHVVYKHLQHSISLFDTPTVQGQGLHIENTLSMSAIGLTNQEVIMRVNSDIHNNDGRFYTDENGYQLIGRKTREGARVETNYYPVTTMAVLEDGDWRISVHTGQSHGAASLLQGSLEFMLDRHMEHDDNRGLGEGITDVRPVISNFILHLERRQANTNTEQNYKFTYPSLVSHIINDHLQQPIQSLFTTVKYNNIFQSHFHPLNMSMPCDYSVVSFKTLVTSDLIHNGSSVVLHRKGFSCQFPVTGLQCSVDKDAIQLQTLFPPSYGRAKIRETTLTHLHSKRNHSLNSDIRINALEMKSFIVDL